MMSRDGIRLLRRFGRNGILGDLTWKWVEGIFGFGIFVGLEVEGF